METLSTDWKDKEISEVLVFVLMQLGKNKGILEICFLLLSRSPDLTPGFLSSLFASSF